MDTIKKILIVSTPFLIGVIYSYFSFEVVLKPDFNIENFSIFDSPHTFYHILINNLKVGLLVSVGGFLSGGILAAIILFWNGYFLMKIINVSVMLNISTSEIAHSLIFHGPIEIFAFFLFGKIGLEGFFFIKKSYLKIK